MSQYKSKIEIKGFGPLTQHAAASFVDAADVLFVTVLEPEKRRVRSIRWTPELEDAFRAAVRREAEDFLEDFTIYWNPGQPNCEREKKEW